jgi:hypothetical protein
MLGLSGACTDSCSSDADILRFALVMLGAECLGVLVVGALLRSLGEVLVFGLISSFPLWGASVIIFLSVRFADRPWSIPASERQAQLWIGGYLGAAAVAVVLTAWLGLAGRSAIVTTLRRMAMEERGPSVS